MADSAAPSVPAPEVKDGPAPVQDAAKDAPPPTKDAPPAKDGATPPAGTTLPGQVPGAYGGAIGRRDPELSDDEDDDDEDYDDDDEEYDEDEDELEEEEDREGFMNMLQNFLMAKLHLNENVPKMLEEVTVEGVVKYLLSGRVKNVITMAGAGISTSAGIPDFRTPGTGLYSNLEKYNLPCPEAIFDLEYFRHNPKPFFVLAKELYPGSFNPTPSHLFIKLLHEKGLLLRHYTQNIDTLEHVAGLPADKVVEAHGTFRTAHCLGCRKEYTQDWMKEEIFKDTIPTCPECQQLVKPDIIFFRESLPTRFFELMQQDFPKCEMLIILGTSLTVQPFASLIDNVPPWCPRLLINREKAGSIDPMMAMMQGMWGGCGLALDNPNNIRDVALLGDCDEGCTKLADLLGWKDDLDAMKPPKKEGEEKKEEEAAKT